MTLPTSAPPNAPGQARFESSPLVIGKITPPHTGQSDWPKGGLPGPSGRPWSAAASRGRGDCGVDLSRSSKGAARVGGGVGVEPAPGGQAGRGQQPGGRGHGPGPGSPRAHARIAVSSRLERLCSAAARGCLRHRRGHEGRPSPRATVLGRASWWVMVGHGELTDAAWERIVPLLPGVDGRGRPWREHRQVINGVLWRLRTGARGVISAGALWAVADGL